MPSSPKLTREQAKLALIKPKGDAEWGTLPANAIQRADLSPLNAGSLEQRRRGAGAKPVRGGAAKVESVIDQDGSEAGTAEIEI